MSNNTILLTGQAREDYIKAHFTPDMVVPNELMIEETTVSSGEQSKYEVWYDGKDEDKQELIDSISHMTYHIIDEEEYDEFIELLDDEGMTSADDFTDRFEGEFDTDTELYEWVEQMIDDSMYLKDVPDFIKNHINYEDIWNCELRYDYTNIQFNDRVYLFRLV